MPVHPSESADVSALHLKIEQLEAQLHESEATCHTQARRIEELEREVASQEEFLHTMLDNFPGGVAIYRTVREETDALLLEFKYLSREWAETWRRSWDEPWLAEYPTTHSVKMDVREFLEEATAVRLWGLIKNREDTANPLDQARNVLKTAVLSKDGGEFWLSIVAFAVEHEGERWSLGFFQDVTEQVEAQEALETSNRQLQASEARFRQLIDEAVQGVVITTETGEAIYLNQRMLDLHGYNSFEEYVSVPIEQRVVEEDLRAARQRMQKRLGGGQVSERNRMRLLKKSGEPFWVEMYSHVVEWEGKPATQHNVIDVDAEVRSRAALEAANELMSMGVGYGSRIQQALLPRTEDIQAAFRAFEVSWEPRDVVSGDFYWFHSEGAKAWLMLGDCTGHGVPGAFMSLISLTVLDRIAYEGRVTDPAGMLEELGLLLRKSLGLDRPDAETDDGLDAAFYCFDTEAGTVTYSGKILPLYRLRSGELEVIKGERGSVGYHTPDNEKPFANHTLDLQAGDRFVLISDGFVDQVCETTGRMYGPKRFRKQLAEHADLAVPQLMRALLNDHAAEQGAHTRRDDLTLMALEV